MLNEFLKSIQFQCYISSNIKKGKGYQYIMHAIRNSFIQVKCDLSMLVCACVLFLFSIFKMSVIFKINYFITHYNIIVLY